MQAQNIFKRFVIRTLFLVLASLALVISGCKAKARKSEHSDTMKVVSFNIRFDNPDDGIQAWKYRLPLVLEYIQREKPDIAGMQEAMHHQVTDLELKLQEYSYVGTGRKDGKRGGEHCPIFFRRDKFRLAEHGQFWLSETPEVPGSIGWEAALPRIVTWAGLEHIVTGYRFFVFNTHLSHVSDLARWKSVELISEKISGIAGNNPVILTGDFNIIKGSGLYYDMISRFGDHNRLDNAELVSVCPVENAGSTFNGFSNSTPPRVIDYIFTGKEMKILMYKVDRAMKEDIFISDHWPVVIEIEPGR